MEEPLWDVGEVARYLNVSVSTVWRWIRSGKLVGQRAGTQWRFDPIKVREAFQSGTLSDASRVLVSPFPVGIYADPPEWARSVLARWRRYLESKLEELRPDNVIVNDRRGAKIWKLLMPNRYIWGRNLWHSTAITLMSPRELRKTFGGKRTLLFDEMMQHGRETREIKERLEAQDVGAFVTNLVCVRRRSYAESGELVDYDALFCEDLDEQQFTERAALISRLSYLFEPPLDADHIVIKGAFSPGLGAEKILEKSTKWGLPFIVWLPDQEHESLAITLDRPQFFNTKNSYLPTGFSFDWRGPGKIRIYGEPGKEPCYCSLVIYPCVEAPVNAWAEKTLTAPKPKKPSRSSRHSSPTLSFADADEFEFRRVYANLCIELAINLFNDFVMSGAAEEIGIHFENSSNALDEGQLHAIFGPTLGSVTAKRLKDILAHSGQNKSLLPIIVQDSLPLPVRGDIKLSGAEGSRDSFRCRTELLRLIPRKYSPTGQKIRPISWNELLSRLPQFKESVIGSVLDDELDRGKVKPTVWIDYRTEDGTKIVSIWRGFCRGEFGPWFEWDKNGILGHTDMVIQRTLGLGPTVVEHFLKKSGQSQLTATHFDKIFSNLQHDLREGAHDLFYLGWRPYKFGPVPVVPVVSLSGEFMEFQRFLLEMGCLNEIKEQHGSKLWRRYRPAGEERVPWRSLYELRTGSVTRAHVAGLVRLYAAIQKECTVVRPCATGSSSISGLQEPLVVLAAARNAETAYVCGWFEINDWVARGELLFAQLNGFAAVGAHPSEPVLKQLARNFASPARLLFDKIEMYRNLPHLRQQIENLLKRGDLEAGEVLLEKIDRLPKFDSHSRWPMKNLEWACKVIRSFSSMTRQVLTACKLDIDERKKSERFDEKGTLKDASFYLKEVLACCPELGVLSEDLQNCIVESQKRFLTEEIANCLSRAFRHILSIFESQDRIPDPRPQNEKNRARLQARSDLMTMLRGISMPQPYAVAILDIRNMRNLPKVSDIFGISYDDALNNLLRWIKNIAKETIKPRSERLCFEMSGDAILLAGIRVEEVLVSTISLIRETTRRLGEIDRNQLQIFALLRAGIAIRDDKLANEYQGIRPGLIAHDLANVPGQALGAVNITKPVMDFVSSEYRNRFVASNNDCEQGTVFVRFWDYTRDSL